MVSSNPDQVVDEAGLKVSAGDAAMSGPLSPAAKSNNELDLVDCREEIRRLQAALKQMRSENLELNRALGRRDMPEGLRAIIEDQAKRLDLMHASLSWRITAPLRMLARLFGAS
ncbi:MAG: hypothetical protein ABIR27_05285 [Dokdonella sp.]